MKKIVVPLSLIAIMIFPHIIYAHPGRTDSSGCHTCRTNCPNWGLSTGEYHCHNAKALPQPEIPIKSTYGENGTGYTTPEPGYIKPPQKVTPAPKPTVKKTETLPKPEQPATEYVQPQAKLIEHKSWFKSLFGWLF